MQNTQKVEYMVFPRMLALAEDVWSTPENKNYTDFLKRLSFELPRLEKQNVNFRIPEPAGLHNMVLGSDDKVVVELTPSVDGSKIYYTTDGSTPDERSSLYSKPIDVDVAQGASVELKTVTVLPSGRKSFVNAATIVRKDYLPSVSLPEKRVGLTYAFAAPESKLILSGETRSLGTQQFSKMADLKQPFSVGFDGYINVGADGLYEFQIDAIGDARLVIDGAQVIDFTGVKDKSIQTGVVPLRAGYHKVAFRYSNPGGDLRFRVRVGIKGQGLEGVNATALAH
jgi:hexosaminidase